MPFRELRRLLVVVAVLLTGLAAPTGALAQEDGVTLDPGSPAGKQYQLPTEGSRRVAGGDGASASAERAAARTDDGGGSGSTTLLVVAVVVVLLVGGGTAVVLRRRA